MGTANPDNFELGAKRVAEIKLMKPFMVDLFKFYINLKRSGASKFDYIHKPNVLYRHVSEGFNLVFKSSYAEQFSWAEWETKLLNIFSDEFKVERDAYGLYVLEDRKWTEKILHQVIGYSLGKLYLEELLLIPDPPRKEMWDSFVDMVNRFDSVEDESRDSVSVPDTL